MTPSIASQSVVVTLALHGNILLVTVDNPPVNALGVEVRQGLLAAIEAAEVNNAVRAVLIMGACRNFIGGADIREFGRPSRLPTLPDVCNAIESCRKPVVAVVHGAALGGGLEVALASHYRIAVDSARLGLPAVQLGLLPGAGGNQRTPRLIGAAAALSLMLSGRHVDAQEALTASVWSTVLAGAITSSQKDSYTRRSYFWHAHLFVAHVMHWDSCMGSRALARSSRHARTLQGARGACFHRQRLSIVSRPR